MLVLSREAGQSILVGLTEVEITRIRQDGVTFTVRREGQPERVERKAKNESLELPEDNGFIVVVEIRKVEGSKMKSRIGVEAPKETPVHRKEVYDAIMRSRQGEN